MNVSKKKRVLYIGGFVLPDRNAAAQRVIGIAKSLKEVGYEVCFVNAIERCNKEFQIKEYYGFKTYEYNRKSNLDYFFFAHKTLSIIKDIKPFIIIAYNYPAIALNKIRKFSQKNGIKCVADSTEWYKPKGGNIAYRIIKTLDTEYRMRYVQKRMDAVIAISRYLFDYYKACVPTTMIPPTVDILDKKWAKNTDCKNTGTIAFVYAGSPSATKEKLDVVVSAIEECLYRNKIILYIVGITKNQFLHMYSWKGDLPKEIVFKGHVSHLEAIDFVKRANWSIILRQNNAVVKAGFPTKLVESISCGTPVIANVFSNIEDFLCNDNSFVVRNMNMVSKYIEEACSKETHVDIQLFDYHNYTKMLEKLLLELE